MKIRPSRCEERFGFLARFISDQRTNRKRSLLQ